MEAIQQPPLCTLMFRVSKVTQENIIHILIKIPVVFKFQTNMMFLEIFSEAMPFIDYHSFRVHAKFCKMEK